jgi:hypothetical protein
MLKHISVITHGFSCEGQNYSMHLIQLIYFYLLQCTLFNSFRPFQRANPQKRLEYLDFKKIVSRELLMNSPTTPSSPATPASKASTSSLSDLQVPYHQNQPQQKTLFQLDGKRKEHVLLQFPPMKNDSTPTRRFQERVSGGGGGGGWEKQVGKEKGGG